MVDLRSGTPGAATMFVTGADGVELDDAAAVLLLTAEDEESAAQLAAWLKTHTKTFAPVVAQAIRDDRRLSVPAARVILDALVSRAPADAETALVLTEACLTTLAERLTASLNTGVRGEMSEVDDTLVGPAVAILTADRRSRHSEAGIDCLAKTGPGGALVLARSFDALRSTLKLHVVRRLDPADVLPLGDNVVASLAQSVSRLAEELESPKRDIAIRFVAGLGPLGPRGPLEIAGTEQLEPGDRVFHASWGTGIVVSANSESATVDFGNAGTRTLLRALATLRHAV